MKTTRISLPRDTADRLDERFDWYVGDPIAYDHSPEEIAACQELRRCPIKRYKTCEAFFVPWYGPDHVVTQMLEQALMFAIEDTYYLDESITASQQGKLQKMLKRWVKEGEFKLEAYKPRPKPKPEVMAHRQKVEKLLRAHVDTALSLLRKPEAPVVVTAGFIKAFVLKHSWAQGRDRSRGGWHKNGYPYISMNINRFDLYDGELDPYATKLIEYASIADIQVIGSCRGSLDVTLAAVVAHEVSHATQFAVLNKRHIHKDTVGRKALRKVHGQGWQEIYRYLRENWVNQMPDYQSLSNTSD